MPPLVDPFQLTTKQLEFVEQTKDEAAKEILFGGAIRSGKSQVAARILVAWALQWPGLYIACRATYRELEDSTKRIFLSGDGMLPPAIPDQLIAKNGISEKHERVTLRNGSQIIFRSLEENEKGKAKIRNITLSGAFVDQLEEFDSPQAFALYEELLGRLSHPSGPRKLIACANPGPETHWAYDRIVNPETRHADCRYTHVTLYDNEENLPADYVKFIESRKDTSPDWYDRFVLGIWGAFGGKRFKSWNKKIHIVPTFEVPAEWEIVEAIDYGWSNPFAVIWCAIDFDGVWWVIGEHYEAEQPISYHAEKIKEMRKRLNVSPSVTYIDPSTYARRGEYESVHAELMEYGITSGRAQNDRLGGWARIDEMLGTRETFDGGPRLRVFASCENLIRELPNLRIKEGTDDVEKEYDHAADALRYAIMSRPTTPVMKPITPETIKEQQIDRLLRKHDSQRREPVYFGG